MAGRAAVWLLIPIAFGTLRAQESQTVRTFRFAATDAKGQPVTDLRLGEIQISDAGKRGSVVFSRFLSAATPKDSALLPHEFTNRASGQPSTSTLILLDLLNADFTERSTVCQEIIQTLRPMAPSATVFLFLLAPDTSVLAIHGWMRPGGSTELPPGSWTSQISDLLDRGLQTAGKIKRANLTDANTAANLTYQALKGLGSQYAPLPGQKRLVWVTRGMPLTLSGPNGPPPLVFQTLLQQIATEFRQFGIPIYTVHEKDTHTANVDRVTALDSLASLTGGRSFENEAAGRAIAEAQTDAAGMYLGGFYPAAKDADDKFHELRVSTTRKGVRILAPSGYTADPPEDVRRSALDLAVGSAFDSTDIGLRVAIEKSGNTTHFQIYVDPSDFFLQSSGRSQTGKLLLSFVYFKGDSQPTATEPVSINVSLTSDQFDAAVKAGYPIEVDQTLPNGVSKVRIVIQDAATGVVGSLGVPIASQ